MIVAPRGLVARDFAALRTLLFLKIDQEAFVSSDSTASISIVATSPVIRAFQPEALCSCVPMKVIAQGRSDVASILSSVRGDGRLPPPVLFRSAGTAIFSEGSRANDPVRRRRLS